MIEIDGGQPVEAVVYQDRRKNSDKPSSSHKQDDESVLAVECPGSRITHRRASLAVFYREFHRERSFEGQSFTRVYDSIQFLRFP